MRSLLWTVVAKSSCADFKISTLLACLLKILIAKHTANPNYRQTAAPSAICDCHSCQTSHYSMSSQRCIHINVMRLHCMGNGGASHYLLKGQWQTMYLRKTEKWKITVLSLNKAVLSNIYGTDGKQGQRRAFIDMIGDGCHRIQVRESTKEKFSIVFGGSAYHRIAPRSFQKSNRLCFTVFFVCVCGFVKALTYIHYQETAIQEFWKK